MLVQKESVQAHDEELLRDTVEAVVGEVAYNDGPVHELGTAQEASNDAKGRDVIAKKWELFVYMEKKDGVLSC
jgi:hypothetical protein